MKRIGILGAMTSEIAYYLERMENKEEVQAVQRTFTLGTLGGVPVVVANTGIGKVNAAIETQVMIDRFAPSAILFTGVAGSLTGDLFIGDILVAEDAVQYDVDTSPIGDPVGLVSTINRIEFPMDARMVEDLIACADIFAGGKQRILKGRAATGERFLTKAEDKRWIVETFGAKTCDMESCAVAHACIMNDVPCAVVRAMSDASDDAHESEYANFMEEAAYTAAKLGEAFVTRCGSKYLI